MKRAVKSLIMAAAICSVFGMTVRAEDVSDDIVILYTNDVHTYIDGTLSYDVVAGLKKELEKQYKEVILVDAGDHIQGTGYGSADKGKTIVTLMNQAGYDIAALGNHEFDYGMFGTMQVIDWADYTYLSCNFYNEENGVRGENVLDAYQIFDCGTQKIAFVGITTPESITKSTPAYFQNEKGEYIYGISSGENGAALYADVQKAIDSAKEDGATMVIALGHLGADPSSSPWTSEETIAHVSGLDAFIDGHSHTIMEGNNVADKTGKNVLLTQTGEYFNRIGMMVIDAETGDMKTGFIDSEEEFDREGKKIPGYHFVSQLYSGKQAVADLDVMETKNSWLTEVDARLGAVIGSAEVTFDNYDNGKRLVRMQETNSGDFAADALYYLFDHMGMDVDVAVMNGGGIRNKAVSGALSYKTCKEIHTFGNVACLQQVTGQQILDALEWGARCAGTEEECGGFLQVSGLTYKIDTTAADTTKKDEKGVWIGGPEKYRVHDVTVYQKETDTWEPLNLNETYHLAGYNYTLRDLGDGFAMFDGAVNVLDYVMEDYMVLSNYILGFEGRVAAGSNSPIAKKYPHFIVDYSTVNGSGRIEMN